MATTSYLYHALGLIGYKLISTEYVRGEIHYHVSRKDALIRCTRCGSMRRKLKKAGPFERSFLALPVGLRMQRVILHGHRYQCKACGAVFREKITFAEGKRRLLKSVERYVVELCKCMTIKQVSQLLQMGWDQVSAIFKAHLAKRAKKRRLSKVRYIAIDEFAIRKGHHYMTIVMDLETGAILYAHEGKDAAALIPFLKKLKKCRVKLKAIALDLSKAYIKAIRQVLGTSVDMVFDRYHVTALMNRTIDHIRRDIMRSDDARKTALKGCRFVLLKGQERLSPFARQRLLKIKQMNAPLYEAYLLKEELRLLWTISDRETAFTFILAWLQTARSTNNHHLKTMAATVAKHVAGILNYFDHRITTGPLEGINNKIKVLKRQAYGFRDMDYFRLRLLFLHESSLSING